MTETDREVAERIIRGMCQMLSGTCLTDAERAARDECTLENCAPMKFARAITTALAAARKAGREEAARKAWEYGCGDPDCCDCMGHIIGRAIRALPDTAGEEEG